MQIACLYGHFDTALAVLQTNLVDVNSTNKVIQHRYHMYSLQSSEILTLPKDIAESLWCLFTQCSHA